MSTSFLEKALGELLAKEPQTAEDRIAIDLAIAQITRGIEAARKAAAGSVVAPAPRSDHSATTAVTAGGAFFGMSIREACAKLLTLRRPKDTMLPKEIWAALSASGFKSNHHDPVHAVFNALKRRSVTHKDVFLVRDGKWGLTNWYTEQELAQINETRGGMPGRDRADHIEKTKAGMALAMAQGARPGAKSVLTPDMLVTAKRMLESGERVAKIAEAIGVTKPVIYKWRKAIKAWNVGDAWPPPHDPAKDDTKSEEMPKGRLN